MSAVFIGGTGRSGTNITRKLLAQSPQVSSPHFETRYTVDPNGVVPVLRSFDTRQSPFVVDELLRRHFKFLRKLARKNYLGSVANRLIKMIPGNSRELLLSGFSYADWNLEAHFPGYEQRLENYVNHFSDHSYHAIRPGYAAFAVKPEMIYLGPSERGALYQAAGNFVRGNIDSANRHSQTGIYVEDNTYNLVYASTIHRLVPEARFIHVRRDPLDVVSSYCSQRWCPDSRQMSAKIIADLLTGIEKELDLIPRYKVMTLTLESLVEESKTQIGRMCDFLDIEITQSMKKIDLARSNMGRSREEFSAKELRELKSILGNHIDSFKNLRQGGY